MTDSQDAWDGCERRRLNGEHKRIAAEAAEVAARKVLQGLGVDVARPLEAQKDFAWLRRRRYSEEQVAQTVRKVAITTAVGMTVTGALTTLWMMFKDHLHLLR